MGFMSQQMTAFGLSYQRLEAITPDSIKDTRDTQYWESWERPLKETEKACFLSHVAAWEVVAAGEEPVLILEDDVVLSAALPSVLVACSMLEDVDHLTLEVRKRKKIVSKRKRDLTQTHRILRLYQDRSGAAAYVLWPSGAKKLLRRAQMQAALADAMICKAYELNSYQAEPACGVQLDQAAAYALSIGTRTQSQIDAGAAAHQAKTARFKLRRIMAQLRMGFRALGHVAVAERREIALSPEDFTIPKRGGTD